VIVLRFKLPTVPRTFKCPAIFIVAPIGLVACLYLLFKQIIDKNGQLMETGQLFIYWFIGIAVLYFIRLLSLPKE